MINNLTEIEVYKTASFFNISILGKKIKKSRKFQQKKKSLKIKIVKMSVYSKELFNGDFRLPKFTWRLPHIRMASSSSPALLCQVKTQILQRWFINQKVNNSKELPEVSEIKINRLLLPKKEQAQLQRLLCDQTI